MLMQLFMKKDSQGAVLRDIDGYFIAAACLFIPNISTSTMAEAIAMREGLELANRMSSSRVQAESDSTDIIDACKGDE
jgi:ribonuclease HI